MGVSVSVWVCVSLDVSKTICGIVDAGIKKTCFQLSKNDSHVYFISGTAGDLLRFAPSCGASHIGCGTLWPRLVSTMCGDHDIFSLFRAYMLSI